MKKNIILFSLFLCLVMVAGCEIDDGNGNSDPSGGYPVFDPSGWSPSPTTKPDNSHSRFINTIYSDRDKLSKFPDRISVLEQAYKELKPVIQAINDNSGLELEIGSVYDVREGKAGSVKYPAKLKLKASDLDRFAGLAYYYNGQWMQIEEAEVKQEGKKTYLSAMIYGGGPYAVILYPAAS